LSRSAYAATDCAYPRNDFGTVRGLSANEAEPGGRIVVSAMRPLRHSEAIKSVERFLLSRCASFVWSTDSGQPGPGASPECADANHGKRGGNLILTLTAHYLAFRLARLPLPMSRTGSSFCAVHAADRSGRRVTREIAAPVGWSCHRCGASVPGGTLPAVPPIHLFQGI